MTGQSNDDMAQQIKRLEKAIAKLGESAQPILFELAASIEAAASRLDELRPDRPEEDTRK